MKYDTKDKLWKLKLLKVFSLFVIEMHRNALEFAAYVATYAALWEEGCPIF